MYQSVNSDINFIKRFVPDSEWSIYSMDNIFYFSYKT